MKRKTARRPQKNEAFPTIVETADEAAAALARGEIIARGELALFATHDWRAALYRRIEGEPWDRAEHLATTSAHWVGEDGRTPGQLYRAAAVAFVNAAGDDGAITFPGYQPDEQRVSASLGKDWRADLAVRAKRPAAEPVAVHVDSVWDLDPAGLLAWARARRGDVLVFALDAVDLPFFAADVAKIGATLPDDATCYVDGAGLHYRWRGGRGGLNRPPRAWGEIHKDTVRHRLVLHRPEQRAA